ncbi:MAG: Gfo/Idh/MocA family oxidoreductase [Halobacteriales archaeon]|nr:Gfo/Idh/MocA family oxidoreductase [Halobacteriales archaeon]
MTELAVGVVGAGWMATDYHVPAFTSHPRTRVVAFAERDDDRRATVEAELSLPGYADAEAMLSAHDLDIVSICTPPSTHEEIFVAAVEAGCHVLCEKPLALTAESARRMAAAADEAGVVTQVGYLHRYYRNYERAMSILSNDLLGELVEITVAHHSAPPSQGWYYNPTLSGGGVARDLFPHSLDVLFELFDEHADGDRRAAFASPPGSGRSKTPARVSLGVRRRPGRALGDVDTDRRRQPRPRRRHRGLAGTRFRDASGRRPRPPLRVPARRAPARRRRHRESLRRQRRGRPHRAAPRLRGPRRRWRP